MRSGSRGQTPTVADAVRRAVDVCESEGDREALAAFALRFEDRDEPVTALGESATREFSEQQGWSTAGTPSWLDLRGVGS